MEYEVTLYQGDHSNEYLLSEMKNGKVEGRCQLFNRGILSLAWMMKNGKRIGGITEYKNGKALQRENWNSILENDGDRRRIENSKEGLIMTIRCKCGKEDSNAGDVVIYRGGFDEEMNRDGFGIEYDVEYDGKEKVEGYWLKDKLIRMIREFDPDNNQMIEYAENEENENSQNVEVLNRIPLYIGGYCIENGKFVRNGVGYLIDEVSGTAIRESEWEHGKEKKGGIDLFEGWYVKGMNESIRNILKNESPGEMKTEPIANMSTRRIEIHNCSELKGIDLKVKDLLICSNCCNDLNELDLNKFESLESIEIGDECFESVKTFKIDGLNRLKTIKIGNNSFTQKTNGYGNDKSKSFHILNCESLESIQIGEYSFSDFAGDFELKNLPQLQSIQIGSIIDKSYNFIYSSFVIRGIALILNIWVMHRSSKSAVHSLGAMDIP